MANNYLTIGGILTLVIALTAGSTIYLQSLGTKTSCSTGWNEFNETHSVCNAAKTPRYEMCFRVYDSTNTAKYWCEKGKLIDNPEQIIEKQPTGGFITCTPEGCK
jgi:hypothetical protein